MNHDLKIIDKSATTWFIHTGAFRMLDPTTGHIFEPGVKYKLEQSEWMKGQPTIKPTNEDEDVEVLEPHKPGDRAIALAAAEEATPSKKPARK